jgi:hypothetical protein
MNNKSIADSSHHHFVSGPRPEYELPNGERTGNSMSTSSAMSDVGVQLRLYPDNMNSLIGYDGVSNWPIFQLAR